MDLNSCGDDSDSYIVAGTHMVNVGETPVGSTVDVSANVVAVFTGTDSTMTVVAVCFLWCVQYYGKLRIAFYMRNGKRRKKRDIVRN